MNEQPTPLNAYEEKINSIALQLSEVDQQSAPRMGESMFVDLWLPFFAGDENPAHKVTMRHWANFAGSPFQRVNIVNAQGQVLFTVPPVFNQGAVNPIATAERVGFAAMLHTAQLHMDFHPAQGTAYLNNELEKRAIVLRVPIGVQQNLAEWNAIFERYGRRPLMEIAESAAPAASSSKVDLLDEYDPL